jgi:hypothetical protein
MAVTPSRAQQAPTSQDYDLSAGVLYNITMNEYNQTSNVGLQVDVAQRFLIGSNLSASALGEIGYNHFEDDNISSYLGGLRFQGTYRRLAPFAQVLLDVERCCERPSEFAIQPGVGVDMAARARFSVRAQVDWRHITRDRDDVDGLRVGVGLVFPLSR